MIRKQVGFCKRDILGCFGIMNTALNNNFCPEIRYTVCDVNVLFFSISNIAELLIMLFIIMITVVYYLNYLSLIIMRLLLINYSY